MMSLLKTSISLAGASRPGLGMSSMVFSAGARPTNAFGFARYGFEPPVMSGFRSMRARLNSGFGLSDAFFGGKKSYANSFLGSRGNRIRR